MSEVKFACPVCGQHITADSSAVGAQVECPSCFRKMIVPQGTASGHTKLVMSASQVGAPRPFSKEFTAGKIRKKRSKLLDTLMSGFVLLLIAAAASSTVYWYQGKVKQTLPAIRSLGSPQAVPGVWTLDPEKGLFPEGDVAGTVQGKKFRCDRATVRGSTLTLRQGKTRPSEMSVAIVLLQSPSDVSTLTVKPNAMPPVPRIVVRCRGGAEGAESGRFSEGYLLNLTCEPPSEGRIHGKLYLALPDESHSYVAGHFDAEIIQPRPQGQDQAEK